MQQWNGLVRKEWALMSVAFYATVGASLVFTMLIPLINQLFNWNIESLVIMLGISILWMMLGAGIPTVIFLISLAKEMNRPDIWLHSTVSVYFSCLELPAVQDKPKLFSTALMWMLAELFESLPEAGDLPKPKLVFFFDEAHLLFDGATKAFVQSRTRPCG